MKQIWTGIRFLSGGGRWVATPVPAGCDSTIEVYADVMFRPERFSREKGIDYSAFVVRQFLIGNEGQWKESPAEDLFTRFRAPMDPVLVGLVVAITVCNVTARPLPFVVSVEGRVMS